MTLGEANVTGDASDVLSPGADDPARRGRKWERALVAALCVAIGWFYLWTERSNADPWKFGREQNDYYNLLIDGWLDGHLHMKVPVPAALLALPDPYDPTTRPPGLALHDASFYHGKYYLYFGAAPLVALMLPFRLLTGIDLPQPAAELVFVYAGFLASVGLFLGIRRRYFPETGPATAILGTLVLGLAGLGPVLLRRPHMWELPIAAGYCFATIALGCVWGSLHSPRRRGWWFAAAGLALGLAIGSRPTYLIASSLLVVPLVYWWRRDRRLPWRPAACAVVPLLLIGMVMAWHNYARFGNPLEFGQTYQFSLDYEAKVTHFSPRYVPFNAWRYFVSQAKWTAYFPFIQPADMPPKPPGFAGHDDVYGVFANLPIAWFALLAPLTLWRRPSVARSVLGTWLGSALILFAAMAGVLLFFFGSLARYESDFTPTLMLLACIGVLAGERLLRGANANVILGGYRAGWTILAVVSCGFAVLFSLQFDGLLGERNPALARRLALALNRVPAAFERIRGVQHGAAEFDVKLTPRERGDRVLLSVGDAPRISRVFVRHLDPERVQFGFAQDEGPPVLSRPMELDFGRAHRLRVTLGPLFPPRTHPFFADKSERDAAELTSLAQVTLDDDLLIDERRRFAGELGTLRVGRDALAEPANRFDAPIGPVHRVTGTNALRMGTAQPGGFVRLWLAFPVAPPAPREPLLAIGSGADTALLFVHYVDDTGQIAFGTVARGERPAETASLRIDLEKVHELVVRWQRGADAARSRVELRLDGMVVSSRDLPWTERDGAVVAGRNSLGETGCAPEFTGKLHTVQRSGDGRDPLLGPGDTLRLRVQLPRGRTGTRDPLVVTGRYAGGDLLMVEYVDDHTARFSLDHWGSGPMVSPPVPIDFSVPHEIDVTLGSLAAPADMSVERHLRRGPVAVAVDRQTIWETQSELFTADAFEFAIGRNAIGGTGCGPAFGGDVLAAERILRE